MKLVKVLKGKKGRTAPKAEKEVGLEDFKLPTEKSSPSDCLQDYSTLLYGKKKIGKTSLTAQVDGMLGMMCEPGGKAQSMFQVSCKDWPTLRKATRLFVADKKFKAASVDTIDYAYEFCMIYVCKKLCIDHPSDSEYGKGWKAVRAEFSSWLSELLHSGKGVWFISHSKDEEFKTRRGETYNKVGASMAGQAKDIVEGLVDIWCNYEYDGKRRYLIINGSDEVDAGHRVEGHFRYATGEPIDRIPMGKNAKEAYRNFVAAFDNKMEDRMSGDEEAPTVAKKKGLTIGVKSKK